MNILRTGERDVKRNSKYFGEIEYGQHGLGDSHALSQSLQGRATQFTLVQ